MRRRRVGRQVRLHRRRSLTPPAHPQINRVRLYSTKTLKALGTLEYHKKSCQTVAFARYEHERPGPMEVEEDAEEEMSEEERADRRRWLAVGSQDNRVSLWSLISFGKT